MMGQTHQKSYTRSKFKLHEKFEAILNNTSALLTHSTDKMTRVTRWMKTRVSWGKGAQGRGNRALKILETPNTIKKVSPNHYTVQSQSKDNIRYTVIRKKNSWSCDCPDHKYRQAQCKHILAVIADTIDREAEIIMDEQSKDAAEKISDISETPCQDKQLKDTDDNTKKKTTEIVLIEIPSHCMHCGDEHIIKYGHIQRRHGTTQRYACKNCNRVFGYREGMEHARIESWAILDALDAYYKGHAPSAIQDTLAQKGVHVCTSTIYRWVTKFVTMMYVYLMSLLINTGNRFCADEEYVSIKGKENYLFAATDYETRFLLAWEVADRKDGHNAENLLKAAAVRAGKKPTELVTDALPSYAQAFASVYAAPNSLHQHCTHISNAGISKKNNNNVQERFNGTLRAMQRPRRGIKSKNSPIFAGCDIYYNFMRRHSSLGGRTPAEAAGITIHGQKWRTVISNAALYVQ